MLSVLLLGASLASRSVAQLAPPAEQWGEPVEGVQLLLAPATSKTTWKSTPPGELPAFEVQIRNRGSSPVTWNLAAVGCAPIEIDGTWYLQVCVGGGTAPRVVIAPGSRSDVVRTERSASALFELNARPVRPPQLRPGPHRVRLRIPADDFGVRTVDGRKIALTSNLITIDIPAPVTVEREAPPARDRKNQTADSGSRRRYDQMALQFTAVATVGYPRHRQSAAD